MCKQFHSRRLERWSKRTVGEECLVLGEKKLHQVVDDVFRGDREEIGAGWELKTE